MAKKKETQQWIKQINKYYIGEDKEQLVQFIISEQQKLQACRQKVTQKDRALKSLLGKEINKK